MLDHDKLERLAEHVHWVWAVNLKAWLMSGTKNPNGSITIPEEKILKYWSQVGATWEEVPEDFAEVDRRTARRYLAIIEAPSV